MNLFTNGEWLPLAFAALTALAVFVYAVLDGYDIGVGILMQRATPQERDVMISSIGPFWDANETWLVLAVGLLLIAFPEANGMVLTNLYMPVTLMMIGLIIRGVSFDFRAKAKVEKKEFWDKMFSGGSFLMALSQGYMVALYVLGFERGVWPLVFALAVGLCVAAAYGLIGASWLLMKTEGALQKKAAGWARFCLWGTAAAIVLVSVATPLVSPRVFERWFAMPNVLFLLPLPMAAVALVSWVERVLKRLPAPDDKGCWKPFVGTVGIYLVALLGLAYSFYPYIVPGKLTIVEAASAPESLAVILIGALLVLPFMIAYTIYAYKVFHGKTRELGYN